MSTDGGTLLYGVGADENSEPTIPKPFSLTGARLLLAVPLLAAIVAFQGSLGGIGAGFAAALGRVVLLALLLYYRGLTSTCASYATLAELAFPATAVVLNWTFLGVGVTTNQVLGFFLLWGAVFVLGYLNAKAPIPDPSAPVIGSG